MVKICDVCGVSGFLESLLTCSECNCTTRHIYCIRGVRCSIPETWSCDECLEVHQEVQGICRNESVELNSCPEAARRNCAPEMGRVKFIPAEESMRVKFIPTEEAKLLTNKVKSRRLIRSCSPYLAYNKEKASSKCFHPNPIPEPRTKVNNIGASEQSLLLRSVKELIKPPSIVNRATHTEKTTGLTAFNSLLGCTEQSLVAERCPPLQDNIAIRYSSEQNKESVEHNKISKERVTTDLITRRHTEVYTYDEGCLSHSKRIKVLESNSDVDASKVNSVKACISDKASGHLNSEKSVSLPAGDSGKSLSSHTLEERCETQLALLIDPDVKLFNGPVPSICWKGIFDVTCSDFIVRCAMQAHLSCQVFYKVYEVSKQMSQNLKFNLVPRSSVWPKIFHVKPPTSSDIGLYFLPSEVERSKEKYMSLLEHLDSHDFALQSSLGDVKLLIYSSTQLPVDSRSSILKTYMFGVFHHVRRKELICDRVEHKIIVSPLDTVDAPPGFESPRLEAMCGKSPLPKPVLERVKSCLQVSPPGFPPMPACYGNRSSSLKGISNSLSVSSSEEKMMIDDKAWDHQRKSASLGGSKLNVPTVVKVKEEIDSKISSITVQEISATRFSNLAIHGAKVKIDKES